MVGSTTNLLTDYELFQRKNSKNWWMRFSIRGKGQERISLKTSDRALAERLARDEYYRYQVRAEDGIFTAPAKFERIAKDYLTYVRKQVEQGHMKPYRNVNDKQVIERYLVPFFGTYRLSQITTPLIKSFVDWRFTYWTEGPGKDIHKHERQRKGRRYFSKVVRKVPSANTVRANCAVLSGIFRYAELVGVLRSGDVPRIPLPKTKPNPRPTFTLDEVYRLILASGERVGEAHLQKRQRYERLVLASYIDIAAYSGLRPVELHNLDWRHIEGFKEHVDSPIGTEYDLRFYAFGKTKPRTAVVHPHVFGSLHNLWSAFEAIHGREPNPDDPVFCNYQGERIKTMRRSLNALLEAEGLKFTASGGQRVTYSFRHFYICQQLLSGVDVYRLATNAGTSVEMIQKFYSKLGPEMFKKELRPSWSRS